MLDGVEHGPMLLGFCVGLVVLDPAASLFIGAKQVGVQVAEVTALSWPLIWATARVAKRQLQHQLAGVPTQSPRSDVFGEFHFAFDNIVTGGIALLGLKCVSANPLGALVPARFRTLTLVRIKAIR